ncbi:iduronate 2-sulfatase [Biomphalaria glabrata]|nr:iduronate 2-sulfatase [Biomphalaria glabrata]
MEMNVIIKCVTVLLINLIVFVASSSSILKSKESSKRQNILFVVVDDLRTSLGCYGEPVMKTLNVDNLAQKSVLFEQAYVQQAICGPSRVSFLTSRRPDTTRLYDFYSYWRVHAGNFTTLPQHFKENGYVTQSVGKVFHPGLASNFSDDSPYSWTNTPYHPSTEKYKMAKVCPNADGSLGVNIVCPVDVNKMPEGTLPDIQIADFAVEFLGNMSKSEQPFFLAVGFQKPHIPLKYPQDFLKLYPLSEIQPAKHNTYPERLPLVAWNPWTDLRERDDVKKLNVSFPFGPLPSDYQLLVRQSYYAATTYVDVLLGRVLSALEENGLAENTVITFIGDHGWSLGEHQEWSKYSLYDVATRVPLLVYIPNVTYTRLDDREKLFDFIDPLHDNTKYVNQEIMQGPEKDINELSLLFMSENKVQAEHLDLIKNSTIQKHHYEESIQYQNGYRTSALVEMVDLFPTLADIAGLPTVPLCPPQPFSTLLCTEGASFLPLIKNITGSDSKNLQPKVTRQDVLKYDEMTLAEQCDEHFATVTSEPVWKKAVFSQYPRPSVLPRDDSDKPHLKDIRIMGYSMWTLDFHYTEWVSFIPANYTILWEDLYGVELYLRALDPDEINNMALFARCASLVKALSRQLHQGWRDALPH